MLRPNNNYKWHFNFHKIIEQCKFIHVGPETIAMGRPNLVQGDSFKFDSTLGWGIPWLYS